MADLNVAIGLNAEDNVSAAAEHGAKALDALDKSAKNAGGGLSGLGDAAEGAVHHVGNLVERITSLTVVVTAAHTLENAFQGLFSTIAQGVVGTNANLETATLQFTNLMGSADLAKEHVADLFEFAKDTPFETGEILTASRSLEVFGGAALNNIGVLTLVGDAAAGTSNDFKEVAYWTGRMYAELQAGRPFGEALQRFQELGIITPKVAAALEDISEKGGDGAEAWRLFTEDLGRFNGQMSALALTWAGLTSTFSDTLNQLVSKAGKPFFDAFKEGLENLNTLLGSDAAQQWSADLAKRFTEILTNLGTMKDSFIEQFTTLTSQGVDPVDAALKTIANSIGTAVSDKAKKDFEELTKNVGDAASAMGTLSKFTSDLIKPTSDLATTVNLLSESYKKLNDIPIPVNLLALPGQIKNVVEAAKLLGANIPMGVPTINLTEQERNALQGGEVSEEQKQRAIASGQYIISGGKFIPKTEAEANLEAARQATLAYQRSIGLIEAEAQQQAEDEGGPAPKPKPTRDTTVPPFPVAGRAGAARAGSTREAAQKDAETAIQGFMEALQAGSANAEAEFGKLGGKLAAALNTALASDTKAGGTALARILEEAVTALQDAGVDDWRQMGDELAAALHDALVAKTPEAIQAAQDAIRNASETINAAQFWAAWAKAGEDAATRINTAIQTTAEKITTTMRSATERIQQVFDNLNLTRRMEAARKAIEDILAQFDAANRSDERRANQARSDRDTATERLRADADAQEQHEAKLAEIRRTTTGQQRADAIKAENDRFATEQENTRKARARQDTDRGQRIQDQIDDENRATRTADIRARLQRGLETAAGVTPDIQRAQDAARQVAAIQQGATADIAKLNADLRTTMDTENAKLDEQWTTIQGKILGIKPDADSVFTVARDQSAEIRENWERIGELQSGAGFAPPSPGPAGTSSATPVLPAGVIGGPATEATGQQVTFVNNGVLVPDARAFAAMNQDLSDAAIQSAIAVAGA